MDCCPSGMMAFCFDQHGGINGRLKIMRDGEIIAEYMNKKWVYLDGISFVTVAVMDEKSDDKNDKGAFDVTPKLENGWSNMDMDYAVFQVFKIENVDYLQGSVKGGK
eukprot:488194_1